MNKSGVDIYENSVWCNLKTYNDDDFSIPKNDYIWLNITKNLNKKNFIVCGGIKIFARCV